MNTAHARESMMTKVLGPAYLGIIGGICPSLGWASGPDSGRTEFSKTEFFKAKASLAHFTFAVRGNVTYATQVVSGRKKETNV